MQTSSKPRTGNVLALISSPRNNGNTEIVAKEIMLNTAGENRLTLLYLKDLRIEPCRGCYSCRKPGRKCPASDHLYFLLDSIRGAEGVILGAPVYHWGPNIGIIKILDRAFLFRDYWEAFKDKPCVAFVVYGIPREEGYALGVVNQLVRHLGLRLKESASFLGALPGDVLKYEKNLLLARRLGGALFDVGYRRAPDRFECPNCFNNVVKLRSDSGLSGAGVRPEGTAECAFCGTTAEITFSRKNGLTISYHGMGLYDPEFPGRLDKRHEASIESFASGKKHIERLTGKYKNMDVERITPE